MKSILKIRILGTDYDTMKKVSIVKKIEVENINFIEESIPEMKINGGDIVLPKTTISAEEQADEWFSVQSKIKQEIIYKHNLHCILNWQVLSIENVNENGILSTELSIPKKAKKLNEEEKIGVILEVLQESTGEFTDEMKANFFHVYSEMKDVLKGMATDKKILIVLRSLNIGLMASINSYDHILKTLKTAFKKIPYYHDDYLK